MANNNLINFFKQVFAKNAYIFLGINAFALIILFFVLDEKAGGSFLMRLFTYIFCVLIGGGLAVYYAKKNDGNSVSAFRNGAGTLLVIAVLISWSGNGYTPSHSSGSSYGSYPKTCKAGCGYKITSSTYDCDGYHCTCVPGKDGESAYDKARRY